MLLLAADMVPIYPLQTLWEDGWSNTVDWCITHKVGDSLTICWGQRNIIGNDINLAESACNSLFCLQSREEAATTQKIRGGCYSRAYDSSSRNSVKVGGIVAKKLASFFRILSKVVQFIFIKCHFHTVKAVGLIYWKILLSRTYNDMYYILLMMIYFNRSIIKPLLVSCMFFFFRNTFCFPVCSFSSKIREVTSM